MDLVAQLWALAVLAVAAGSVRTLGWRTFVSAGMAGFLAMTALAVTVGRPVVTALGPSSLFAHAVWVPVTEELCKAIPVIFVVIVALRRTTVRPLALDLDDARRMDGRWIRPVRERDLRQGLLSLVRSAGSVAALSHRSHWEDARYDHAA